MSIVSGICFLCALFAAVIGCLPRSWIFPIGPLIGRPNAITVEVHQRGVIVCWILAGVFASTGAWLFRYPQTLMLLRQRLGQERKLWRRPVDRAWWAVLAITGIGAIIRGNLLSMPMAYDESYTFLNYARKSLVECMADLESPNNHILNSILMWGLYRIGGPHEAILRLGVFLAGVLLIPLTYLWAKGQSRREVALLVTSLVAVSPALITYSVDARGYMYWIAAAVSLDLARQKIRDNTTFPLHWKLLGIFSVVIGAWAMPLMLYSVVGCGLAWGIESIHRWRKLEWRDCPEVISWLIPAAVAGVVVFILYIPAFVFRGGQFLTHSIMQPLSGTDLFHATIASWQQAWQWWTAGGIPGPVWLFLVGISALRWLFMERARLIWFCPLIAFLGINLWKGIAPPPRVYLALTPWMTLAAAEGTSTLLGRLRLPSSWVGILSAATMAWGMWTTWQTPVLIHPEERNLFLDVPAVVGAVSQDRLAAPDRPVRLMAPIPVDYSTRFYLERGSLPILLNGQPEPGDCLYVIVIAGESIRDTFLRSPILMPDWPVAGLNWREIRIPEQAPRSGSLKVFRTQVPESLEKPAK